MERRASPPAGKVVHGFSRHSVRTSLPAKAAHCFQGRAQLVRIFLEMVSFVRCKKCNQAFQKMNSSEADPSREMAA